MTQIDGYTRSLEILAEEYAAQIVEYRRIVRRWEAAFGLVAVLALTALILLARATLWP